MSPEQEQLLKNLQAAISRNGDPAERKDLLEKLERVRADFETEPWRDPAPAQTEAHLRRAKRVMLLSRIIIGTVVVATMGTLAWFWSHALRLF
jgi:hypothetical protein